VSRDVFFLVILVSFTVFLVAEDVGRRYPFKSVLRCPVEDLGGDVVLDAFCGFPA